MLKQSFTLGLLLTCCLSFGQMANSDLSTIKTIADAEVFMLRNPGANGKLFTIDPWLDTCELITPLYDQKSGFVFKIANYDYKILETDSILCSKVNYIYLNGAELTRTQIDSLRKEIIRQYKSGTSFQQLVEQYNMDGNPTGGTRWFGENFMVKEFETAVRQHKKGDIFTVDTPALQWYHVVLKTYDDTYLKKMTIFRIISTHPK